MAWRVSFSDAARRSLRKLNPHIQDQITDYLNTRLASDFDPRRFGKPLAGNLAGCWRYRVGDHRLICRIQDGQLVVMVIALGHCKSVYQ